MTTQASASTIPEHVRGLAAECGFTVHGWDNQDEPSVIVTGTDVNYIGSRAEAEAFMTAWHQCLSFKIVQQLREEEERTHIRHGVFAFDSEVELDPAQSAQMTGRPQAVGFRGERIGIPDDIAGLFAITDIMVGMRSTFVQSMNVPGTVFAARIPDSLTTFAESRRDGLLRIDIARQAYKEFGRAHSMPTCMMAQDLIVRIVNVSDRPARFSMFILGKYA